jgi:hypothetical protein
MFKELLLRTAGDSGAANTQTDPETDGADNNSADSGGANGADAGEQKTFTQEALEQVISERLKRAKAAWEKDTGKKIQEAKSEAEKLAKLSEAERDKHEREQREAALTAREAALIRKELKLEAHKTLNEKKLPMELLEALDYSDADACNASIEALGALWTKTLQRSIEDGVNARLKSGGAPSKGAKNGNTTEEELMKALGIKQKK